MDFIIIHILVNMARNHFLSVFLVRHLLSKQKDKYKEHNKDSILRNSHRSIKLFREFLKMLELRNKIL